MLSAMYPGVRISGLFYKTGDDLSQYSGFIFCPGLRNNEYCMCVTADPVNADEMKMLMRAAMPDFDDYVSKGQIGIHPLYRIVSNRWRYLTMSE